MLWFQKALIIRNFMSDMIILLNQKDNQVERTEQNFYAQLHILNRPLE